MVGVLKFMVCVIVYYFLLHFTAFDLRLQYRISFFFPFCCSFFTKLFPFFHSAFECVQHMYRYNGRKERFGILYTRLVYENIVILYDSIRIIYFVCVVLFFFLSFLQVFSFEWYFMFEKDHIPSWTPYSTHKVKISTHRKTRGIYGSEIQGAIPIRTRNCGKKKF